MFQIRLSHSQHFYNLITQSLLDSIILYYIIYHHISAYLSLLPIDGLKAFLLAAKVRCDLVKRAFWLRPRENQVSEHSWCYAEFTGGIDSEVIAHFNNTVQLTEGGIELCNMLVTDVKVASEVDRYL